MLVVIVVNEREREKEIFKFKLLHERHGNSVYELIINYHIYIRIDSEYMMTTANDRVNTRLHHFKLLLAQSASR